MSSHARVDRAGAAHAVVTRAGTTVAHPGALVASDPGVR